MSKVLSVLLTGVGASVVAAGGILLFRGGNSEQTESTPKSVDIPAQNLSEFKEGGNKFGECTRSYFSGLSSIGTDGETLGGDKKVEDGYFSSDTQATPQSCLMINWERKDSTEEANQKWTGNFRLEWSFVNGDKGFVLFASLNPSSEDNKLALDGGIYVLKKEGSTWKIDKKKELEENKKLEANDFETLFPEKGDSIIGLTGDNQKYWGFVTGSEELNKVCKTGDDSCPKEGTFNTKSLKKVWLWKKADAGSNKPYEWSKKTDSCVFGICEKSEFDFEKTLGTFLGTWEHK